MKPKKIEKNTLRFSLISSAILLCAGIALVLVGRFASAKYKQNLRLNSAVLLGEYGQRVSTAINKQMSDTWSIAASVSTTLEATESTSAEEVLPVLKKTRDDWKLNDIVLYTESGACMNSEGNSNPIDQATEISYYAQSQGKYLNTVESRMFFSVPVTSSLLYDNSKVVALSVIRDQSSMIADQDITSFNDTTVVYLCQSNGLIISRSANADSNYINVTALFNNGSLINLKGGSNNLEDAVSDLDTWYFTYTDNSSVGQYVVDLAFVQTDVKFQLVIATPMNEVDKSMNQYSSFINYLYVGIGIIVLLLVALGVYLFARQRGKNYRAMADRDKMLNLLVSSTDEVFVLFLPGKEEAEFRSTNEKMIFGDASEQFSVRAHSEGKVYIRCSPEGQALVKHLNDALEKWDQKSDFTSDFVPVFDRGMMRYFILSVSLPEKKGRPYVAIITDATKEHERE
ncbi:MAG: hypothetical protein LKM30_04550 [Bacilli bacterium]|nr:hypothetical protein [Bacilli bacterium]